VLNAAASLPMSPRDRLEASGQASVVPNEPSSDRYSRDLAAWRSHGARTGADRANDTLAAKHLDRWLVRAQVVDLPAPLAFSGSARQRPAMAGWPAAMG
jgi:hypothetical protein